MSPQFSSRQMLNRSREQNEKRSCQKIGAIILAAGFSSRMGALKPLMVLGGQTLLACCAKNFRAAGVEYILVVTGHHAPQVRAEALRLQLECVHNADHAQGMFSSIQIAAAALPPLDAFFVTPVDIPLVRPVTMTTLSAAYDAHPLVPVFNGERGHPALLPFSMIPRILAWEKAGGLQSLLEEAPCQDIEIWDQGVLLDADTPEDFSALVCKADRMEIGEPEEALALARMSMSPRNLAHGMAVARVAVRIGEVLNTRSASLDLNLLHNAAVLHDIAKGPPQHEYAGARRVHSWGLNKVADIVACHRDTPLAHGQITEKEVLCLADKLVSGTSLVSVHMRFDEKLARFAHDPDACTAIQRRLRNILALQQQVELATNQKIENILAGITCSSSDLI